MHVTRQTDLNAYPAINHHGMAAFRLHGLEASPAQKMWVGLSIFLPGGGAEKGSSPSEKVYIVLEGEITVVFEDQEVTLRPMDSILIQPDETRTVENRSKTVARMIVISPT